MGQTSSLLASAVVTGLMEKTHFTEDQIKILFAHFEAISSETAKTKEPLITRSGFQKALGNEDRTPCLFTERIFQLMDTDRDGYIQFNEFILGLALLSDNSSPESRAKFAFRIYDIDNDGKISSTKLQRQVVRSDLRSLLQAAFVDGDLAVSPAEIGKMTVSTISAWDTDNDGKLSESEFLRMVDATPNFLKPLTVQLGAILEAMQKTGRL